MTTLSVLGKFLQPKTPRAYRAGATLQRVMLNLRGLAFEQQSVTSTRFCTRDSGISGSITEKLDPLLFAHTVTSVFRFELSGPSSATFRVALGHRGALRRQGISCKVLTGEQSAAQEWIDALQLSDKIHQHWLPLDAKTATLISSTDGVYLEVEHFGGSEVVASFPNIRRYVRITPEQWQHLLKLVRSFKQLAVQN